jgi:hypothetical protein
MPQLLLGDALPAEPVRGQVWEVESLIRGRRRAG